MYIKYTEEPRKKWIILAKQNRKSFNRKMTCGLSTENFIGIEGWAE